MVEFNLYLIIALVGTLLFCVKLISFLYGAHADFDIDFGSVDAFEVFSLQSILAMLMGIGWSGLALQYEFETSFFTTLILSLIFGLFCGLFSSALMYMLRKLNYIPVPMPPQINSPGIVYLEIPKRREGQGKVELIVDGQKKIIDAITDELQNIVSFSSVTVIQVISPNLVLVKKA